MPCRSDYMDPTPRELYLRDTALHLCYLRGVMGLELTATLCGAARDAYTTLDYTAQLCQALNDLPVVFRDSILNRDDLRAVALKKWWLNHLEVDRRRIAAEEAAQRKAALVASAKAKLTPEELEALGVRL